MPNQTQFPSAFNRFVAPARVAPQAWRMVAGLVTAGVIYAAWAVGLVFFYGMLSGPEAMQGLQRPETPAQMYVLLATFVGMGLGVMVAVRLFHRQPMSSLFGRAAWVLHDFATALVVAAVIYGVSYLAARAFYTPLPNLDLSVWLAVLPLAVIGILVQTGAEELVFRGYLQQQLAARFQSPLIWMVLPSALFAVAHYDPSVSGNNAWMIVVSTGLFGLAAADLTARTGSIGAAWGLHFANNAAALLVVAVDGTLQGVALYKTPFQADAPIIGQLIWIDLATFVVTWAVLRRVLHR